MENSLVTIVIPVYNGANTIKAAIDSVIRQTYDNIELIISDNRSTDKTENILLNYVQNSNVRYYKQPKYLPVTKHFYHTRTFGSGKYFMWLACDDRLHPNAIAAMVESLEREGADLCFGVYERHDHSGNLIDRGEANYESRYTFFRILKLFWLWNDNPIYGLFRRKALADLKLDHHYRWPSRESPRSWASLVLLKILLRGNYVHCKKPIPMLYRLRELKNKGYTRLPTSRWPIGRILFTLSFFEQYIRAVMITTKVRPLFMPYVSVLALGQFVKDMLQLWLVIPYRKLIKKKM